MESSGSPALDSVSNEPFVEIEKDKLGEKKESDAEAAGSASANSKKNGGLKENGHSILNSVNKSASQIKKPPHRRSASPLNWFPRKKMDSFLKRKIRLLQEVGGMNASLDETLGNANPHYSRIAREKIAAQEAARKAMEARKAAMVEASWCRILQAARIKSKEAEAELDKAEKEVAEAFEAAKALGVMMYDRPDCPRHPCEIETSSAIGGGSTHTVTASFETAFEVDKEVAAAVKKAFIWLASCPSATNQEEFRHLLHKISQNPGSVETDHEPSELSLGCESDPGSELEAETLAVMKAGTEVNQRKPNDRQLSTNLDKNHSVSFAELVNTMLNRLKGLQEDQLSSLATIVATRGLNAALLEVDSSKDAGLEPDGMSMLGSAVPRSMSSLGTGMRRFSSITRFMDRHTRNKDMEIPSLDKFLVKHVSRLEREVQEARKSGKRDSTCGISKISEKTDVQVHPNGSAVLLETTSDLGNIPVEHVSGPEKDIQEAKDCQKNYYLKSENKSNMELYGMQDCTSGMLKPSKVSPRPCSTAEIEGNFVMHFSQVEDIEGGMLQAAHKEGKQSRNLRELEDKENVDVNMPVSSSTVAEKIHKDTMSVVFDNAGVELTKWKKPLSRVERAKLEALKAFSCQVSDGTKETHEQVSLDKILVKPVHRLEKEKVQALEHASDYTIKRANKKQGYDITASESLDKVLVKHVSRLEKEKMAFQAKEGLMEVKKKLQQPEKSRESLDKILVKHQSKLEKAKLDSAQQSMDQIKHVDSRREVKLQQSEKSGESLDEVLVKHQSKLEKAKLDSAQQSMDQIKHVDSRREARERELLEAWGGLSLGNSIRPHLSRLERDKAAWRKAEEEERRRAVAEL